MLVIFTLYVVNGHNVLLLTNDIECILIANGIVLRYFIKVHVVHFSILFILCKIHQVNVHY